MRVFPPWGLDLSRSAPVGAPVTRSGIGHGGQAHGGRDGNRGGDRGRIRWDSATVTGPHGTVAALTGVTDPAVTVTRAGGTFAISSAGPGDHTLDATVSWACP